MTNALHRAPLSPPTDDAAPRRALLLAGGGMRVAYQAGVLKALAEAGLTFAHADGTSGGTINLAMLLSGQSPREMCERWRTLPVRDFVSFMPFAEYLKGPKMNAMSDADGIREAVFPHLGIDADAINAAQGMSGTFNVCNFTRKTCEAIPHDAVDTDLLVAGISLPIFMPPVRRGNTLYTDAVWIKDTHLMEAVRRGADELWLVWCIGNTDDYAPGPFRQYVHMIEMSANGALFEEFERIRALNVRIAQGETPHGRTRPLRLHVIKPTFPLPLDPDLYFGRITTSALIDMGYADAAAYLDAMDEDGLPLDPSATQMQRPRGGITFRETMEGPFALGATDAEAGARRADDGTATMALHARVEIHDLDRFIEDPDHAGRLTGHLDFPPFGKNLTARRGRFNLFSPGDAPDRKRMVYDMAFEHEGQSYYLAGRKEIHDDPGLDLWNDTTTLFARLHEGRDATGPVVGAGVLTLGATDLAHLVSTMQATGTTTTTEGTPEIVLKFGRFFLGELFDSYV